VTAGRPEPAAFTWRRLAPALAFSAVIVAAAPFLGQLRDLVLGRLPRGGLLFGTAAFGILVAAALVVALLRVRRQGWARRAGFAACLAALWAQLAGFSTGIPHVDVVERVHVLEYGLAAILFYRAFAPLPGAAPALLAALAGTLVGIFDEWLQWLVASRVGEARDVGMNAAAAATGTLLAIVLFAPPGTGWRLGTRGLPAVASLAAVTTLAFAGFFHCAHLGYEVRDESARLTFVSWHAPDELPAVAAAKDRRWQAGDTPTLDPWRRQDYFFVEGASHVAHRNASLERGDFRAAWAEQRLLERHYAPVLAQRGLGSGEPLDLAASAREELRRRAQRGVALPYASPALTGRIVVTPSKPLWWAAFGGLSGVLLGVAWRSRARSVSGPRPGGGLESPASSSALKPSSGGGGSNEMMPPPRHPR
jgi:hypothetical protein